MRRICCCGTSVIRPAPTRTPDLVADLPPHTRDSNDIAVNEEEKTKPEEKDEKVEEHLFLDGITEIENPTESVNIPTARTPSIHVEDLSEKSLHFDNVSEKNASIGSVETTAEQTPIRSDSAPSNISTNTQQSLVISETAESLKPEANEVSEKSSPISERTKSATKSIDSPRSVSKSIGSARSENTSPEPVNETFESQSRERDVRTALTECIIPPRHEDWEVIVNGLLETERLAKDEWARAPAASWRASARSVAAHVRSLRSRVARAACSTLGALFEYRGRALDPELEEATSALLERCADVNRFLRADATIALGQVACGGQCARAGVALARRGATHRGGPVRAAAAQALTRLVQQHSAERILDLPNEPRTVILRAAGELIADASPEARLNARHLCLALAEDMRFRQLLKEAMPPSRYRAIEKFVDKLRCR